MSRSPSSVVLKQALNSSRVAWLYAFAILLMTNLNALVDVFFHPDIPYLDEEHLVVGLISGAVSALLIYLLHSELRSLKAARVELLSLESILPICSFCKKIRAPEGDPKVEDSWHPIERYISERTSSEFTHGVCPECMAKYFPPDSNGQ